MRNTPPEGAIPCSGGIPGDILVYRQRIFTPVQTTCCSIGSQRRPCWFLLLRSPAWLLAISSGVGPAAAMGNLGKQLIDLVAIRHKKVSGGRFCSIHSPTMRQQKLWGSSNFNSAPRYRM